MFLFVTSLLAAYSSLHSIRVYYYVYIGLIALWAYFILPELSGFTETIGSIVIHGFYIFAFWFVLHVFCDYIKPFHSLLKHIDKKYENRNKKNSIEESLDYDPKDDPWKNHNKK